MDTAARTDGFTLRHDPTMAPQETAGRLYVVATSHLDTQWRWTVRDTIERFLPATLEQAFARFDKYPFFVLSFEGSFRYRLIREYYPENFERLRGFVRAGRWHPAGAMIDAPDVNIVAPESLVRHILYGNRFFEREMGVRSRDVFLPDCFGFGWALPTIARHCGLAGFSSQKMVKWTLDGGIPFDLGLWEGPDGSRLPAALRPGGYGDKLEESPARSAEWIERVRRIGVATGHAIALRYFGVGDRGGAPDEASIEELGRGLENGGPLEVVHGGSDRIFTDLEERDLGAFPVHAGELLLPTHGTGCLTSQLRMKRWNRQCESLGDAAERAACLAAWLGAMDYPAAELRRSWERFLWHQMHDDLTGTSVPAAYRLSWNDQALALKGFATVLIDAVTAVARGLSTTGDGQPLVVYNASGRERSEPVTARVRYGGEPPAAVRVVGPGQRVAPSQIVDRGRDHLDLLFVAAAAPVSLGVYRVEPVASAPACGDELVVSRRAIENSCYRVEVSERGEAVSILDKRLGRELLAGPVALQLLPDRSRRWPAWEMLHRDVVGRPRPWRGECQIEVEERGPVRAALRIERRYRGSTLVQRLRLHGGDGAAAQRIEWACELDWRTWRRMLKVAFPLAAASPRATYDLGLGAIERGVDSRTSYEVPAQRWAGQHANGGDFGVVVFTNAGYGWDKPDEATLRHTLVRSPLARHHFRHQSHQDFGPHRFTLALTSYAGEAAAAADTELHAAALDQPLTAFQTAAHEGPLGSSVAFLDLAGDGVAVRALKRIEDPVAPGRNEWIVRLAETRGDATRAALTLGAGLVAAREVDGCERDLADGGGQQALRDGRLETGLGSFQPRTFALRTAPPERPLTPLDARPLDLDWDHAAASFHRRPAAVDFDGRGNSLPGELLPDAIRCGEVAFRLGPIEPDAPHAMTARGQRLLLPQGTDVVFVLATAVGEADRDVELESGGATVRLTVHPWSGFVGQHNRWPQYRGWRIGDEEPGYVRRAPVAWTGTHRHGPGVTDQAYVFCYLYRYEVAVPAGAGELVLPLAEEVRVFAATAAHRGPTGLRPATNLVPPP